MSSKEFLKKIFEENNGKPKGITWYELGVKAGLTGTKEQIAKGANDYWRRLNKGKKSEFVNPIIIGDLHIPFERTDYLSFCKDIANKNKCDGAIFMGDIIDNHFSSYHTTSPEGFGAAKELKLSIERLAKWYEVFPNAVVLLGNHDRIVQRKVFDSGIPRQWIKSYNDVLGVPNWIFTEEFHNGSVYYVHGIGSTARVTALRMHKSAIQGHRHSECYTQYVAPGIFGTQCPTGIDRAKYAFDYMKYNTNPIYNGCITLLNNTTPIIHLMS